MLAIQGNKLEMALFIFYFFACVVNCIFVPVRRTDHFRAALGTFSLIKIIYYVLITIISEKRHGNIFKNGIN